MNLFIFVSRDDAAVDISNQMSTTAVEDLEKGKEGGSRLAVSVSDIRKGRPNLPPLITDCLTGCASTDRVAVGACGPRDLLKVTRDTVFQEDFDEGPSISLHTEVSDLILSNLSIARARTDLIQEFHW